MSLQYNSQANLHVLTWRSDISTQLKIAKLLLLWNLSFSGDENEDETQEFIMQLRAFFISISPETNVRDIFFTLPMIFKRAALKWYVSQTYAFDSWIAFKEAFEARFVFKLYDY
ncbi:hypothetical protein TKK_0019042 [Trichogramma kaykai]|uniref:Retrotransposon gag domain-containing protein n=1 Tax=Trichogramma kaykai TaxID=54128 RepID=A0ABD2VUN7_9HYME